MPDTYPAHGVPSGGPGEISPAILSVRFHGHVPTDFIGRLRQIGAEIDPTLTLRADA